MKWIALGVLCLLFLVRVAYPEDVIFKETTIILKEDGKTHQLKKGDELPVRVVIGDSALLGIPETRSYDYGVMKWKVRFDTTAIRYSGIKSLRYERSGRVRGIEGASLSPLFLLGGKEEFHWLYIRHAIGDPP